MSDKKTEKEPVVLTNFIELPKSSKRAFIVTINRPNQLNAFNTDVCHSLANIFHSLAKYFHEQSSGNDGNDGEYEDVVAVILTGRGKSFCAGADLSNPPNPLDQSSELEHHLRINPVFQMDSLRIPIIAAIRGHCITGGFELALACDILVGDTTSKFRDTHVKFNVAPCWGLSQKLQRKIGYGRASLVSYTAQFINANQAFQWGLLDEIVGVDDNVSSSSSISLDVKRAIEIADDIGMNDNLMVQRYKNALKQGGKMDLEKGLQRERQLGMAHYLRVMDDGKTMDGAREFITNETRPRSKL